MVRCSLEGLAGRVVELAAGLARARLAMATMGTSGFLGDPPALPGLRIGRKGSAEVPSLRELLAAATISNPPSESLSAPVPLVLLGSSPLALEPADLAGPFGLAALICTEESLSLSMDDGAEPSVWGPTPHLNHRGGPERPFNLSDALEEKRKARSRAGPDAPLLAPDKRGSALVGTGACQINKRLCQTNKLTGR